MSTMLWVRDAQRHDKYAVPVAALHHVAPSATTNLSQSRIVNPWRESAAAAGREVIGRRRRQLEVQPVVPAR